MEFDGDAFLSRLQTAARLNLELAIASHRATNDARSHLRPQAEAARKAVSALTPTYTANWPHTDGATAPVQAALNADRPNAHRPEIVASVAVYLAARDLLRSTETMGGNDIAAVDGHLRNRLIRFEAMPAEFQEAVNAVAGPPLSASPPSRIELSL